MTRVLYKTVDIRSSIRDVLKDPSDRRIILVAFVGADARTFLPNPKGIKLYCWPRAGGTNPDAIEDLKLAGVKIIFVDRLHAKIFWSKRYGAVIGSANLTSNAIGAGRLFEAAVRLPPEVVKLDRILKRLKPLPNFDVALERLQREHILFYMRNPNLGNTIAKPAKRTFGQWIKADSVRKPRWRLGWWEEAATVADDTIDAETKGHKQYFVVKKKQHLNKHQFVLEFRVSKNSSGNISVSGLNWWIPQEYRKTKKPDWKKFPHIWFAFSPPPTNLSRPFYSKERKFKHALEQTLTRLGGIKWLEDQDNIDPDKKFLNQLYRNYLAR